MDGPVILPENAPGTVLLEDLSHRVQVHHGNDGTIVLQPQPSSDPNDPLNWSMTCKVVNFGIIAFYSLWIYTLHVAYIVCLSRLC
ncbi:hypothetical protein F5884DRAFT_809341, partial [Xylogone sp. PMI_703]